MKTKIFTLFVFMSMFFSTASAQTTVLFQEDFTGGGNWAAINNPSKWFSKIIEGSGRGWSTITGIVPSAPAGFSYNRDRVGADNWLITASQVDLSSTANSYLCELSFGLGYYVANEPFRFHVLVTETFDGTDPLNSTWTDITDLFVTTASNDGSPVKLTDSSNPLTPPSAGYPGVRPYLADLTSFAGKKLHLAFRDMLLPVLASGTYSSASFHLIDNIKVSSTPNPLASVGKTESILSVWSSDESIYVKPASETRISVYSVSGKTIISNILVNDIFNLKVSKGVYLIKANDEVKKIVVN